MKKVLAVFLFTSLMLPFYNAIEVTSVTKHAVGWQEFWELVWHFTTVQFGAVVKLTAMWLLFVGGVLGVARLARYLCVGRSA